MQAHSYSLQSGSGHFP